MEAKTIILNVFAMAAFALCVAACKKSTPPTVKIYDNISTSYTSANVTGEVTDEGSTSVTERGFIYGKQGEARQDTLYCGSGIGEFPTRLTGLEPNTTYNCFAFAKNDGSIGTSNMVTFTTRDQELPTVTTTEVENIGTTTVRCGGNVIDDGGAEITDCGICWSKNHNPTMNGNHVSLGSGLGEFACNLSNLSANTTYYVRAYAKNSKGVAYSKERDFTTLDFDLPEVSTAPVTDITQTSAKCSGEVTSDGGTTVAERGVCWSTSHNPTVNNHKVQAGEGMGSFTCNITGLNAHTKYYVRAYATNSKDTAYGNEVSFITSANLPTVSTSSMTNITTTSAKGGGNVINDGGATVTERGICWSTSHNPTISGSHDSNGTGTGIYTVNMTGLTPNTTYYVKAYAINSEGTGYGEEVNFKTSQTPTYTISVSANPTNGGTVTGGGTYEQGQSCTISARAATGYIFLGWTYNGNQVSPNADFTFTVNGNRSLVAQFMLQPQTPTGAINGLFSISATQLIWFSQGNLQYKASTNIWRFATNQYDIIGNANSNISSSYSGWIDLFGWGTSGWNCGNTHYHPWDFDDFPYSSQYGPPGNNNLTGSYVNSDWGYYNSISNGGNTTHQWRTLTRNEWTYVFNTRKTSSGIRYAKAKVNNVNGVILLPDNWSNSYYSLSNTNSSSASFGSNVISSSTWTNSLQTHGAVFLPATGRRRYTIISGVGGSAEYWSASYNNSECAWYMGFTDSSLSTYYDDRYVGRSVRLVCPAN